MRIQCVPRRVSSTPEDDETEEGAEPPAEGRPDAGDGGDDATTGVGDASNGDLDDDRESVPGEDGDWSDKVGRIERYRERIPEDELRERIREADEDIRERVDVDELKGKLDVDELRGQLDVEDLTSVFEEPDHPGAGLSQETAYDHRDLSSLLSEHDLAFATKPEAAEEADLAFDPANPADAVFPQSVSSGGPTPTGVILWTRIDPEAFEPGTPLALEVARDPEFDERVYAGSVSEDDRIATHDHTVKVDLDGTLEPDTEYHYRFVYGDTASRAGRCHTLPAPDSSPDSLRVGVLTCQNYLNGYYGAFHHLAEEDLDFVLHVGDFIYESATGEFKGAGSPALPEREHEIQLPSGEERVDTLEDYRYLYRTYKSEPFLQEALERHTLVPAWDDHEMADDIYWDPETEAPRAEHPKTDDPEFMTRLTADAIHAWWEFMPARVEYDPEADALHERFQLWRSFEFGDLVDLVMTDERLFRSPPREKLLPLKHEVAPEREPPDRTMLGPDQREWFEAEVRASDAHWTVWSDEVLTIPLMLGAGPLTAFPVQGGWDGYTREREYLTHVIDDADVRNFVTLTGDMHCYVAGYKQTEYRDALGWLLRGPVDRQKRVGVEFMTPPVTSQTVSEALTLNRDPTGISGRILSRVVRAMNPHLEFFDSDHWGYSVVEFTREDCTYVGYSVDKTVDSPDADKEVLTALRVPDGEVGIQDVTGRYRE
jgi:alkaline phosphatase D